MCRFKIKALQGIPFKKKKTTFFINHQGSQENTQCQDRLPFFSETARGLGRGQTFFMLSEIKGNPHFQSLKHEV